MRYMRIVAKGVYAHVQTSCGGVLFDQVTMKHSEFENFMRCEFPEYWKIYEKDGGGLDALDFFYHYGETPEMIRKGESYIFTK